MTDAEKIDLIATKIMGWKFEDGFVIDTSPARCHVAWNPLESDADCAELRRKLGETVGPYLLMSPRLGNKEFMFSVHVGEKHHVEEWAKVENSAVVNCAVKIAEGL